MLRSVMRASVREFAARLGISPRTVSHWQERPERVCRPAMAQILDATLNQCTPEEREAFQARLAVLGGGPVPSTREVARPAPCTVISHKFLPVYLGQAGAPLYAAGATRAPGPGGLEQRVLSAGHRTAQDSTVHIYACGVAVVHLEERRRVSTLTELALWRYRTYAKDPGWVGQCLASLLSSNAADPASSTLVPQYVLSAYELLDNSWAGAGLDTALQLITTPSVLVDRQDPENVRPLGSGTEEAKFRDGWAHPEAVIFGGGVSRGVAGWSGVAYHPRSDERALTMNQIVELELDAQALWTLSSHVLHMIEEGQDPVMPADYGWRFLRSTYFRLTTARPTETAQHRAMREAILATSELPSRLRAAQDTLRETTP